MKFCKILFFKTSIGTLFTGLLTFYWYNAVYTPLKKKTALAIIPGSLVGALPPVAGWLAAGGNLLDLKIGIVALYFFVWQIPHFMAIAWLYRADFSRAGFPLLPVVEPTGRSTARQAVLFSLVLVPLSLVPYFLRMSGAAYAVVNARDVHGTIRSAASPPSAASTSPSVRS